MLIRQLNVDDTQSFCNLIVNMYSDLENLEWFSPMPYDFNNVKSMIENPRFYIIGVFMSFRTRRVIFMTPLYRISYKIAIISADIQIPYRKCPLRRRPEYPFPLTA